MRSKLQNAIEILYGNIKGRYWFGNREYNEGSTLYGIISTINHADPTKSMTISLLGVMGDRRVTTDQPKEVPIMLDFYFMLVDTEKTIIKQSIDITDKIKFTGVDDIVITLEVDVYIDIPLPQVRLSEGDGNSGFNTELEDWNEVEVPITQNKKHFNN